MSKSSDPDRASARRRALRSRRVLMDGIVAPRTVLIEDGIIAGLEPYDVPLDGIPVEDLGDLLLMAALTDVHVHVNEPGRTDWEGFETATRAAAAGGVATLIDMPLNSAPVTTTAAAFEAKLEAAARSVSVDVGFWGGVVPEDLDELPELLASGVLGLKAFLIHSGIEDFPNVTGADLERAMPTIAPTGLPLLVHCELDVSPRPAPAEPANPRSYRRYLASRPGKWELDAIALVLDTARRTGARVHIVHLSCADALPMLAAAKAEGLAVTVETCPHYLVLDAESIPDGDTRFKCAPPIRERANRDRLWRGLAEGIIDFIATDHSPCPPELKKPEEGDFMTAWGGIASIQFLLPLVWTEARKRGFGLADIERWLCSRPAAFAGLAGRKGRLAPGYRADLVAWDPDAEFSITADSILYRHKISPYGGRSWSGVVRRTWLGGEPVWGDGQADPSGPGKGGLLLRGTAKFDSLGEEEARAALKACCASDRWVDAMAARRPFGDFRTLSRASNEIWGALGRRDRLQAFSSHPAIGNRYRGNREQAGVVGASEETLRSLERGNEEYRAKFGFPFLVFATGRSADEMLAILEARLKRAPEEEWLEAGIQHHRITQFRLAQLER